MQGPPHQSSDQVVQTWEDNDGDQKDPEQEPGFLVSRNGGGTELQRNSSPDKQANMNTGETT